MCERAVEKAETGCLVKEVLFLFPISQLVLLVFESKGSVVCLVLTSSTGCEPGELENLERIMECTYLVAVSY